MGAVLQKALAQEGGEGVYFFESGFGRLDKKVAYVACARRSTLALTLVGVQRGGGE